MLTGLHYDEPSVTVLLTVPIVHCHPSSTLEWDLTSWYPNYEGYVLSIPFRPRYNI